MQVLQPKTIFVWMDLGPALQLTETSRQPCFTSVRQAIKNTQTQSKPTEELKRATNRSCLPRLGLSRLHSRPATRLGTCLRFTQEPREGSRPRERRRAGWIHTAKPTSQIKGRAQRCSHSPWQVITISARVLCSLPRCLPPLPSLAGDSATLGRDGARPQNGPAPPSDPQPAPAPRTTQRHKPSSPERFYLPHSMLRKPACAA